MAIDNCPHDFDNLAAKVLPEHFAVLDERVREPIPLNLFTEPKVGRKTLLKRLKLDADPPGAYVLIEGGKPIYVGITRGVIGRLLQHVRGDTHYDASLAYRMAALGQELKRTRGTAMRDSVFREKFEASRERLRQMSVAFVEIPNPVERYLFEVYAAMRLDTGSWNTFETH